MTRDLGYVMLTREWFQAELTISQKREEQTYKDLTLDLYKGLQDPLKTLYDQMVDATANLTTITVRSLQQHPHVIKILRYCLAPTISQMRLGQIVGIGSTRPFEVDDKRPSDQVAGELAQWFQSYLDRERFPWTLTVPPAWSAPERQIAEHYAKLCTVALVSNQNTDTLYRNKRQKIQEDAIAAALVAIGLILQAEPGQPQPPRPRRKKGDPRRPSGISSIDDVQPGSYVKEKVILTGLERNQKSDLTVRPAVQPALFVPPRLFCIEAKAVGIRIDSAKRLKELNDKFTDWNGCPLPIFTLGVCAGFFNAIELMATIRVKGIPIFFEHDLAHLGAFLQTGNYFGSPWDPKTLFTDVPQEELQAALEKITSATDDQEEQAGQGEEPAG